MKQRTTPNSLPHVQLVNNKSSHVARGIKADTGIQYECKFEFLVWCCFNLIIQIRFVFGTYAGSTSGLSKIIKDSYSGSDSDADYELYSYKD